MNRGVLRFHVGRTPVAVQPWFWVTGLLLGLGSRNIVYVLLWVPVLFVSILVHEMGHALAFRRFGSSAVIEMHGLGGVTMGRVDRAWQDMVVSLAGPFAGFVLGIPIWFLAVRNTSTVNFDGSTNIVAATASLLFWANVLWGIFNLLPMLPLDGGHALDAFFVWVRGHDMTRTTQVVSIVTGIAVLAWSFVAWLWWGWSYVTWIMLLVGLALWANIHAYRRFRSTAGTHGQALSELVGGFSGVSGGGTMAVSEEASVVSLDKERKRRRKSRSVKDDVQDALAALERHDQSAALAAVRAARRQKPGGRTETLLVEIEAWAHLAGRDAQDAGRLVDELPKRSGARAYLQAGIQVIAGDRDQGAIGLADAMLGGGDDHSKLLAVELAASEGITEEVARHLLAQGSGGFEETLRFQMALKRLGRTGHAAIVDDVILGGA